MTIRKRWMAAIVGMSFLAPVGHAEACKLLKVGALPIVLEHNKPLVAGKINGADVRVLIDTGAFASLVWRRTAESLDLPMHAEGIRVSGVGGAMNTRVTKLRQFSLGNYTAEGVNMLVVDGGAGRTGSTDVILGADVLENFDIEINYRESSIGFYRPKDCDDAYLNYWSSEVYLVPMYRKRGDVGGQHIVLNVKMNGKPMTALLDTGAMYSTISDRAAERIGMGPDSANVEASGHVIGIGREVRQSWIGTFDSFEIGDIQVKNAKLRIVERKKLGQDIVLGSDFIQAHRILVSYSQQRVYFQYLGGPIFNVKIDDQDDEEVDGES